MPPRSQSPVHGTISREIRQDVLRAQETSSDSGLTVSPVPMVRILLECALSVRDMRSDLRPQLPPWSLLGSQTPSSNPAELLSAAALLLGHLCLFAYSSAVSSAV